MTPIMNGSRQHNETIALQTYKLNLQTQQIFVVIFILLFNEEHSINMYLKTYLICTGFNSKHTRSYIKVRKLDLFN